MPLGAQADNFNWILSGTGDWSNAANWSPGLPFDSGVWDVATINNGGTAVLNVAQPGFEEVQVGNSGVAGNLTITSGGILTNRNWLVIGRTGSGGNTPMSTLILEGTGKLYKSGDGFIVGDSEFCYGTVIVKDDAQVNISGGWNGIGNGNGGVGYLTLQNNAVYTLANQDWNIGDWGSGRGYATIKDNATLNVSRFWVGKNDTSFGILKQSGGAVVGNNNGANEWCIGGENGGATAVYGYYELSAGTLFNPNNLHVGKNGRGVFYQTGGANTQGGWFAIGRMVSGSGAYWQTAGSLVHNGNGGTHMIIGEQGHGEYTLSGAATLDCATTLVVSHGYGGGLGVGYCNFNGGTATVLGFEPFGAGGSGYLNLNGTTVMPKASVANFMQGLTEVRVLSGNAIFDTAGYDIGIAQALVNGSGQGVLSYAVSTGGTGYQAPPIIQITGDGVGATAVAQVDPVAGTVTNIVVTSPGYGYTTASASAFGGGASADATFSAATIGAVTGGGIVKNGAGTLTLTGLNSYNGASTVNGGKLIVGSDSFGAGSYSVAASAGLGAKLQALGVSLNLSALTLAGTSSLDFDMATFGNPTNSPVINVAGALAVNGAVTVNIGHATPAVGPCLLMQYASRSGAGSFVLGTLPTGVQATLVDDTANKKLILNITSVGLPRWEGLAGGFWDVLGTTNWIEQSTGLPTFFNNGAPAMFNDQALGTTTVTLNAAVSPAGVTFTNDTLSYAITGTGKISGTTGLTKQGTNSVAIATANDYTGVTTISGGTLSVASLANGGVASPIGMSSAAASSLMLAGGKLQYTGSAVTIDRGYTVQSAGAGIETVGDLALSGPVVRNIGSSFNKSGAGRLSYVGAGTKELSSGLYNILDGSVLFDGTGGGQTNHNAGELWVAGSTNTGAALVISNTVVNIDSWFAIGRGNGTVSNLATTAVYDSRLRSGSASMGYDNGVLGNLGHQILTLNGSSTYTNGGDANMGESAGAISEIYLKDNSVFYSGGRVHVGWHTDGITPGRGVLNMSQSAKMFVNAWYSIGHEGGEGTMNMKDNSSLWVLWDMNVTDVNTGTGLMNIQDNASLDVGSLFVGKGAGSSGTVNQTSGTLALHDYREAHVGFHGAGYYNLSGGTILAPSHWFVVGRYADGPGQMNVSGGTFVHGTVDAGRLLRVGEEGVGELNLSGTGEIRDSGDALTLGNTATGTGTVNLNGGTLQVRRVLGGPGAGYFNFNGGLLRAGPNANADFMTGLVANVNSGGAKIDTGTNHINIAQVLQDGGGAGGLTKSGTGTLNLDGLNAYTGVTTVSAGTLGGNGTIAGALTLAASTTLAPGSSGIGILTVNGTVTLPASGTTVMELSKNGSTNDLLTTSAALAYNGTLVLKNLGGVLVAGDTFKVFNAPSYSGSFTVVSQTPGQTITWDTSNLTVDGTVKVATAVAAPVSLGSAVSGNTLNLTWPISQLGYRLEAQTNSLTVGVNTNWVNVPGSSAVTSWPVPIVPGNPTVFYRLVFP